MQSHRALFWKLRLIDSNLVLSVMKCGLPGLKMKHSKALGVQWTPQPLFIALQL